METALVSVVSIGFIIIASMTMIMNSFQSASLFANSWKEMEEQAGNIRRTEVSMVPPEDYLGGAINLTVENDGQTNLGSFTHWDVIGQRQSGAANYAIYTDSYPPGSNQWTVLGIYLADGSPEAFDPDILNPGEHMTMAINLSPEIGEGETGRITVSTPNGVTSQCLVIRPIPPPP
jgi:hypothetical protein